MWGEAGRGTKWKGYKLRTIQDDIEDGTVIELA